MFTVMQGCHLSRSGGIAFMEQIVGLAAVLTERRRVAIVLPHRAATALFGAVHPLARIIGQRRKRPELKQLMQDWDGDGRRTTGMPEGCELSDHTAVPVDSLRFLPDEFQFTPCMFDKGHSRILSPRDVRQVANEMALVS